MPGQWLLSGHDFFAFGRARCAPSGPVERRSHPFRRHAGTIDCNCSPSLRGLPLYPGVVPYPRRNFVTGYREPLYVAAPAAPLSVCQPVRPYAAAYYSPPHPSTEFFQQFLHQFLMGHGVLPEIFHQNRITAIALKKLHFLFHKLGTLR